MLHSGELERLVECDGICGASLEVSSVERSLASGTHGSSMAVGAAPGMGAKHPGNSRVVDDARAAADVFRPIYAATDGRDGFVSVPLIPFQSEATAIVADARALWGSIDRPNVLISMPATTASMSAMRTLTTAGINVHATLVFGRYRYAHVANAFIAGLRDRAARGLPLDRVASVASICLSDIDALIDPQLEAMAGEGSERAVEVLGQAAIAEARLVHARHRDLFHSDDGSSAYGELGELARQGARPQRLMWTKVGRSLKYIEALVERDTIAELSVEMIEAYRKLGRPRLRSVQSTADAALTAAKLAVLGLGMQDIETVLETVQIHDCIASHEKFFAALDHKPGESHLHRF
jgi:transaldolase